MDAAWWVRGIDEWLQLSPQGSQGVVIGCGVFLPSESEAAADSRAEITGQPKDGAGLVGSNANPEDITDIAFYYSLGYTRSGHHYR